MIFSYSDYDVIVPSLMEKQLSNRVVAYKYFLIAYKLGQHLMLFLNIFFIVILWILKELT